MQTFLPSSSFIESTQVLDNRRLGKQRVEALQILDTLLNNRKAWANHPAVRMWRSHEYTLSVYCLHVMLEWKHRGFRNDRCQEKYEELLPAAIATIKADGCHPFPFWIGDESFHSAHRAVLLAKDPEWYSQFGWKETPAVFHSSWPYVWPV